MRNYIFIDGVGFTILAVIFIALFIGFIVYSNLWLDERRRNEKYKRALKEANQRIAELEDELYKKNFKVPEVTEGKTNGNKKQNSKVNKDV